MTGDTGATVRAHRFEERMTVCRYRAVRIEHAQTAPGICILDVSRQGAIVTGIPPLLRCSNASSRPQNGANPESRPSVHQCYPQSRLRRQIIVEAKGSNCCSLAD